MSESRTLRDGASRVEVYNEGLAVYVYDRANSDAILALDPVLLDMLNPEENASDPAMAEVGARGLIVVYELYQDDEIDVEVSVGPPFDADECRLIGCEAARFARLDVPSGELCVETPNSFRLGGEIRAGGYAEPGGALRVPPGRYVLGLHRVDWGVLAARGIDGHEAWGLAHEFLTLTPEAAFDAPAGATLEPILWISPEPVAPKPRLFLPPADPATRVAEIIARVVDAGPAAVRLSAGPAELSALGVGQRGRFFVHLAGDRREAILCGDERALFDERSAFFRDHPEARRPPARDPAATVRLAELDRAIERQVGRWMKAQGKPIAGKLFDELQALKVERHELSRSSEPRDNLPWLATISPSPPGLVLVPMNASGTLRMRPDIGSEVRMTPQPDAG